MMSTPQDAVETALRLAVMGGHLPRTTQPMPFRQIAQIAVDTLMATESLLAIADQSRSMDDRLD